MAAWLARADKDGEHEERFPSENLIFFNFVGLAICAVMVAGCTWQQYEQSLWSKEKREEYRQREEKSRQYEADKKRFKEELAAHPPTFPKVTIGMSFATLEQQILELNPLIVDPTTDSKTSFRQVTIERVAEFGDTKTITYELFDHDYGKTFLNISYVIITVQRGIVVGYSR